MTAARSGASLIDAALKAFIGGPVAINLASHDAAFLPSIARGYGCKVSADRRRVTVFLSVRSSESLLCDLRSGAPIAVAFCRPKTHATLQFKGTHAAIVPVAPRDREIMRAYGRVFRTEIFDLGYHDAFSSALVAPVGDDAVAVEFAPSAAFEQTPGPEAGKPLLPKP